MRRLVALLETLHFKVLPVARYLVLLLLLLVALVVLSVFLLAPAVPKQAPVQQLP